VVVASWIADGWAVEARTGDAVVLRQDGNRIVVGVDGDGVVTSTRLTAPSGADGAG